MRREREQEMMLINQPAMLPSIPFILFIHRASSATGRSPTSETAPHRCVKQTRAQPVFYTLIQNILITIIKAFINQDRQSAQSPSSLSPLVFIYIQSKENPLYVYISLHKCVECRSRISQGWKRLRLVMTHFEGWIATLCYRSSTVLGRTSNNSDKCVRDHVLSLDMLFTCSPRKRNNTYRDAWPRVEFLSIYQGRLI